MPVSIPVLLDTPRTNTYLSLPQLATFGLDRIRGIRIRPLSYKKYGREVVETTTTGHDGFMRGVTQL